MDHFSSTPQQDHEPTTTDDAAAPRPRGDADGHREARSTGELLIRPAEVSDVAAIVAMLADDPLGATRESPEDLTPYLAAYSRLASDPHQRLVVAERAGKVVGTLQLTLVPGLSRRAATRSLIEGVRVHADEREAVSAASSSSGPSRPPAPRAASSSSSPPTPHARTPTGSTSASVSSPPTWGSSGNSEPRSAASAGPAQQAPR